MTLAILLVHSSESRPFVWCIIGFIVGLYVFFQGFRLLERRHLILNTPVSKIRSASLGMVELSGLAVGPYTMIAPITERPCYYYRTVAWEWKRQGRSSQWVKVAAECMHLPFFLDDNTGRVLVDPRGAELDLHRDFQEEFCDSFFTLKKEAPGNVRSFLSRHGVSTADKIKVEEFCIKPKNALFVLGTLHENPGLAVTPQPIQEDDTGSLITRSDLSFSVGSTGLAQTALSFAGTGIDGLTTSSEDRALIDPPLNDQSSLDSSRASATQLIHLSPDPSPTSAAQMTQQQKIAAALLKAGIASPAAWAAARVTPSALPLNGIGIAQQMETGGPQAPNQPIASLEGFDPHPAVVMMKGKNNLAFLISWRSQRDLARSLGWKCTLMIWGGPALSLVCLYGLHAVAHWF